MAWNIFVGDEFPVTKGIQFDINVHLSCVLKKRLKQSHFQPLQRLCENQEKGTPSRWMQL